MKKILYWLAIKLPLSLITIAIVPPAMLLMLAMMALNLPLRAMIIVLQWLTGRITWFGRWYATAADKYLDFAERVIKGTGNDNKA